MHYFITYWPIFSECWCNGLLKCISFRYKKKNHFGEKMHFKIAPLSSKPQIRLRASSLVLNVWANQMSVKIALVQDHVFVPTGWVCSLISRFRAVAATLNVPIRKQSLIKGYEDWQTYLTECQRELWHQQVEEFLKARWQRCRSRIWCLESSS